MTLWQTNPWLIAALMEAQEPVILTLPFVFPLRVQLSEAQAVPELH